MCTSRVCKGFFFRTLLSIADKYRNFFSIVVVLECNCIIFVYTKTINKTNMATPINKLAKEKATTFETRILQAVWNDDNKQIEKMMIEAEDLYKEGYLTKSEFNTMTDIELIKEIYS